MIVRTLIEGDSRAGTFHTSHGVAAEAAAEFDRRAEATARQSFAAELAALPEPPDVDAQARAMLLAIRDEACSDWLANMDALMGFDRAGVLAEGEAESDFDTGVEYEEESEALSADEWLWLGGSLASEGMIDDQVGPLTTTAAGMRYLRDLRRRYAYGTKDPALEDTPAAELAASHDRFRRYVLRKSMEESGRAGELEAFARQETRAWTPREKRAAFEDQRELPTFQTGHRPVKVELDDGRWVEGELYDVVKFVGSQDRRDRSVPLGRHRFADFDIIDQQERITYAGATHRAEEREQDGASVVDASWELLGSGHPGIRAAASARLAYIRASELLGALEPDDGRIMPAPGLFVGQRFPVAMGGSHGSPAAAPEGPMDDREAEALRGI